MSACPICDTALNTPVCPACGYDRSRDYEAYPTFGPVPAADALSRRRASREATSDVIRCAKCGSTSFALQAGTMLPVCSRCGTVFTPPQPEKPRQDPKPPKQKKSPAPDSPKSGRTSHTAEFDAHAAPRNMFRAAKTHSGSPAGSEIISLAGGFDHTAFLYGSGKVRAVGNNEFGQCNVGGWTDIIAISAARGITVGLKSDGTVVIAGDTQNGKLDVSKWMNITAIAAGPNHILGIDGDTGCMKAVGVPTAMFKNGASSMEDWIGICSAVKIAAGHRHSVCLKEDGTVAAYGDNSQGQCDVSKWTDIVAIAAGESHTVGLKKDGTVVTAGRNKEGQCRTGTFLIPWRNITAIAAGDSHTVALRSDGTVLCCGSSTFGKCDTRKWTHVKAIAAGSLHTLGLTEDGMLLAAGWQAAQIVLP